MRNNGGLRVVEDNAFLVVDQTRLTNNSGKDGIEAKDGNLVHDNHFRCIKDLALPCEGVDKLGDFGCELGARWQNDSSLPLPIRNGSSFGALVELIELDLGHLQQLCDI